MTQYAKAIAAFVTPLVLTLLVPLGIGADTTVGDAIYILIASGVTAFAVWAVPNKGN